MRDDVKDQDSKGGLEDDFLRFVGLKANDLEMSLDDPKLLEHCKVAFHCIHCAAFAFLAVGLSAESHRRFWHVIDNWIRWLQGLPGMPLPNGDPLDTLKVLSPLLEVFVGQSTRDLEIRRVVQRLERDGCGCLPSGSWSERTSHAAAIRFAEDVIRDMWTPIIGVVGLAEARSKEAPRFEPDRILPRHRSVIRRSLRRYQSVELLGLLRGINSEVACALKGRGGKRRSTVLFLAADPPAVKSADRLRLDEEVRAIEAEIRSSTNRDELDLRSAWAVRASDLSKELLFRAPVIVHFACHGDFAELELAAENALYHLVTHEAILSVFRSFRDVRLVFLNVCNSAGLANQLVAHVDCAIGMNGAIEDKSAVLFAGAVYRALASGKSVAEAFSLGKGELELHGCRDMSMPILAVKKRVDSSALCFTGTGM